MAHQIFTTPARTYELSSLAEAGFVPMASFAHLSPVITIGSLSKRLASRMGSHVRSLWDSDARKGFKHLRLIPELHTASLTSLSFGSLSLGQVRTATEMLLTVNAGAASHWSFHQTCYSKLSTRHYTCEILEQAAVPAILSDAHEEFHRNVLTELKSSVDAIYTGIDQIQVVIWLKKGRICFTSKKIKRRCKFLNKYF